MEKSKCYYDYENRCDCREDDNCGCTYPNNMGHDFTCPSCDVADEKCGCTKGKPKDKNFADCSKKEPQK